MKQTVLKTTVAVLGAFVDLIVILCKPGPYYYV